MSNISEFFQREDTRREMEALLPDPVKRAQVIHIQELVSDGNLDEAERLINELDEETKETCVNVSVSLLLGFTIVNFLQS